MFFDHFKIIADIITIYVIDLDKDDNLFEYISCVNAKCESLWSTIFVDFCVIGFHGSTFVMSTMTLAICYFTKGHFDTNLVYHPHHEMQVKCNHFVNAILTRFYSSAYLGIKRLCMAMLWKSLCTPLTVQHTLLVIAFCLSSSFLCASITWLSMIFFVTQLNNWR